MCDNSGHKNLSSFVIDENDNQIKATIKQLNGSVIVVKQVSIDSLWIFGLGSDGNKCDLDSDKYFFKYPKIIYGKYNEMIRVEKGVRGVTNGFLEVGCDRGGTLVYKDGDIETPLVSFHPKKVIEISGSEYVETINV